MFLDEPDYNVEVMCFKGEKTRLAVVTRKGLAFGQFWVLLVT